MMARVALVALFVVGCNRPEPRAIPAAEPSPVVAHVERFVAAGKTVSAYSQLAVGLADARVGNPAAAADAELRLVALAAQLAETMRSRPIAEQTAALALTVWPVLLDAPVQAGESAETYIDRMCTGPLRSECASVEPEHRAVAVRAVAIHRADLRMHESLASCIECRGDLDWQRIGWRWESLDRDATGELASLHHGGVIAAQ